jgi:hypothetical protein
MLIFSVTRGEILICGNSGFLNVNKNGFLEKNFVNFLFLWIKKEDFEGFVAKNKRSSVLTDFLC